jgi:hypothetical protein
MSYKDCLISNKKWYPYNKGGNKRRWYGNMELVVNYQNGGYEIYKLANVENRNCQDYPEEYKFKECVTWSTAGSDAFRFQPKGSLFDTKGMSMFIEGDSLFWYILALCNSVVALSYLKTISPGIDTQVGQVRSIPTIVKLLPEIDETVQENIDISKADWDAHETSWDFKENELLRIFKGIRENPYSVASYDKNMSITLETVVEAYKREWECIFMQLHKNEEELNRQFIEIYGLQNELSPEVPLEEVTILQQGEKTVVNSSPSDGYEVDENTDYGQRLLIEASKDIRLVGLYWNEDNIIQQLISYAVGCYMGRYRLDRPGLHIAHPNPSAEELAPYEVPELVEGSCLASRSPETFSIDEDAIIPILPIDAPFPDNAANRITNFVKLVFGTDNINENMNFIQDALGMSVADYMTKSFYTDHKKRYQNRPIYWLFSSKKGAFQCLVYMHRMNRFTVGRIRDNYLLPYIQHLETKLSELNVNAALLSSAERKEQKRKLAILQECREYDNILHLFADRQIDFDLDDGVLHNYSIFKDILAKLK